jgi:hypothetical protein
MKRFKWILLILFTTVCLSSRSQTQSDLPGDWNVTKVSISNKSGEIDPESLKKIENLFMQTQFHFKADGTFFIDSPQKALQFKKSQWAFDDKEKSVTVTGTDMQDNTGKLLKFFVKNSGPKLTFIIDEAMIQLEVEKYNKK